MDLGEFQTDYRNNIINIGEYIQEIGEMIAEIGNGLDSADLDGVVADLKNHEKDLSSYISDLKTTIEEFEELAQDSSWNNNHDMDESRRSRCCVLKEAHRNHTDFIPYTMRQYYNEYDKKWHPCVVYINSRDNGDWWFGCFDEWEYNDIGWDYEKFTKNGTSKCDPEEVKRIEDIFISDSKEYGNVPLRRVSRLRNFGSGNNYIGKM